MDALLECSEALSQDHDPISAALAPSDGICSMRMLGGLLTNGFARCPGRDRLPLRTVDLLPRRETQWPS